MTSLDGRGKRNYYIKIFFSFDDYIFLIQTRQFFSREMFEGDKLNTCEHIIMNIDLSTTNHLKHKAIMSLRLTSPRTISQATIA